MKQTTVQPKSNFRLIVVEVVCGETSKTFDVPAIELECFAVILERTFCVLQQVMEAS